jgi:acid phosphatase
MFIGILIVSSSQLAMSKSPNDITIKLPLLINELPRPDHVVIVIEENKSYKSVVGNELAPYINKLANDGALFTNSYAITHPSQPNYLALFSGSTQRVTSNKCINSLTGDNLANLLQKNGLSFAIYSESMPSAGFTECSSADHLYERKHNPAVNWQGKNISPEVNLPFESFPSDYRKLPKVSMIIPNQISNMHENVTALGQVSQGNDWLESHLDAYVQWAKINNSLLIITWDEDDGSDFNHIPTIFIGPMINPGQYSNRIDHYNVLRTITDMYGLSAIGHSAEAQPIVEIWKKDK